MIDCFETISQPITRNGNGNIHDVLINFVMEQEEPYEGRLSRTVPWERRGETPLRDPTSAKLRIDVKNFVTMKTINMLLILIFLLVNTECKKSDMNQENSLLLGVWTLTAIQNVKTNQIINYPDSIPQKESITFTDSASVLRFGGVCNEGWGSYSINENKINISPITTTLMLCKNIIWEYYLENNLENAFMYTIYANQLIIRTTGTFHLIFEKIQ